MDYTDENDESIDIICQTSGSEFFDQVIGHIEDVVLSEPFQVLHEQFLEKYWSHFEDTEENKLEYMDIFEEYTNTFETFFIEQLNERMDNFDMEKFAEELNTYATVQDTLGFAGSEIFELLYSFNSFQTFKELMLDYRIKKEGHIKHLDFDILITKPLHQYDESLEANTLMECSVKDVN